MLYISDIVCDIEGNGGGGGGELWVKNYIDETNNNRTISVKNVLKKTASIVWEFFMFNKTEEGAVDNKRFLQGVFEERRVGLIEIFLETEK